MTDWLIYRGTGEPHGDIDRLPPPPPWRAFDGEPALPPDRDPDRVAVRRLGHHAPYRLSIDELEIINAALYLRRPLLITGAPGSGKSTIPFAIAHELGLGRVLTWPVFSRSTLRDGLYAYDAIGRLQDAQLEGAAADIGRYVRLGPLGTALLPWARPRVLLIDEIDKSDVDLPNDLLNVLEEGEFAIPELERAADRTPESEVLTADGRPVTIRDGRIRCRSFPVIVLTSNGERDFPPPLLRRCLRLELRQPNHERLASMVQAHLGDAASRESEEFIWQYLERSRDGLLAVDQLLNAVYLAGFTGDEAFSRQRLAQLLMTPLDRQG
ncbi:MoxR family ATPase [Streptomyces sp. NBC_00878]|uniref:AAA family ATPase n=1 Tax=Streptomyces sp. NBC_00878 TaxID=2975854 RepID=UPI00224EDB02|nr:AAA family ATPase [Streptomyces sp. NBC_00878]MCX4905498.1 AAA family ATPase [Streptomyces sp. NBC_00878]